MTQVDSFQKELKFAVCKTYGPEVFYSDDESEVAFAKVLCRTCPVSTNCLEVALSCRQEAGVWGGYHYKELSKDCVTIVHDPFSNHETAKRLIAGLKQLYYTHGRMPRETEVVEASRAGLMPGRKPLRRIFVNWRTAKKVLALELLRDLVTELGHTPTHDEIRQASRNNRCCSVTTLRQMFGTAGRALEIIGCSNVHRTPHRTDKQLVAEFVKLCIEYERILSPTELERLSAMGLCAAPTTYDRRLGSYKKLLVLADGGLKHSNLERKYRYKKWPEGELIRDILSVTRQLQRAPSWSEIDRMCRASRSAYERFGSTKLELLRKTGVLDLCEQMGWPVT